MRTLFKLPRGFNADGRTFGLGLAVAMEKQREDAARGVEEYLRRTAEEKPVTTALVPVIGNTTPTGGEKNA